MVCYLTWFLVAWFIFFFKQKTAYEMRISDWSSDVCSSDLFGAADGVCDQPPRRRDPRGIDPVLRHHLHRLAQAPHATEHRHRRRRGRVSAADRLGGGDRAGHAAAQIGSASLRERVCPYV